MKINPLSELSEEMIEFITDELTGEFKFTQF